jgi:hypothetical protein
MGPCFPGLETAFSLILMSHQTCIWTYKVCIPTTSAELHMSLAGYVYTCIIACKLQAATIDGHPALMAMKTPSLRHGLKAQWLLCSMYNLYCTMRM